MRRRINQRLMLSGVSIDDIDRYISPDVVIGQDTVIHPNTVILGKSVIGEDCSISPNVEMNNVEVGNEASVCFAKLENVKVQADKKLVHTWRKLKITCKSLNVMAKMSS